MNTIKTERLHALDSLRAIMMMLGLVMHSGITYATEGLEGGIWPLKDPLNTTEALTFLTYFIHYFRMPIFFMMSGFFGALLFYERTVLKMINNRIKRIVYPFLLFLILLYPIVGFSVIYTGLVFTGDTNALANVIPFLQNSTEPRQISTAHLWFLNYLIYITLTTVIIAILLKKSPAVTRYITRNFRIIFKNPILRIITFSLVTILLLHTLNISWVGTASPLVPNIENYLFYLLFYLVGWVLFKSKDLLKTMMRYDWVNTLLGLTLFSFLFFRGEYLGINMQIVLNSLLVWLLIFGISGLFIRFLSNHSKRMRYVSDASYWIYLVHIIPAVILPSFLVIYNMPAILKFLIVLTFSTFISFITYHYFVRSTFIGKFLNGRKYPITRKALELDNIDKDVV